MIFPFGKRMMPSGLVFPQAYSIHLSCNTWLASNYMIEFQTFLLEMSNVLEFYLMNRA